MANSCAVRFPAEWEPQSGVQLTWPNVEGDWRGHLDWMELSLAGIAREVSRRELALIVCSEPDRVTACLREAGADLDSVRLFEVESNDIWARDHGALTVLEDGHPVLLDFGFNGWGLKYPSNFDNQITRKLAVQGAFGATPVRTMDLVFEGGSIESDGAGTLMTTSTCLLSPNRNPAYDQARLEARLLKMFGAKRVLWLDEGHVEGDDTDSHIDTMARFCDAETIAYVGWQDAEASLREPLQAMEEQLRTFRTAEGRPYRLVALPGPVDMFDEQGDRLPAAHANFLIINGAVLVPTYDDPKDQAAIEILKGVFPTREVVGVDCRGPVLIYGSLHCVTMQYPKGVLA